ncbi:MAG TPA: gluconate 2-dehydrogenase subunit 3 family protein [Microbacterium sp.]|uniref:gluconate 2-dehydrogenase subunit 3 family protein n=1 Tax=Microbacterium sp. TaxID=51671 RepID=UPI002B467966|nr:gluconate 2-dehydrogenase subunit 3 family protein [Microbacterium sp.]HKT56054.1 gluconate 2-dehydrogenase subunit 3 family protein [Microbacterium sp.]
MSIARPFENEPRFPGFHPLTEEQRWDEATRDRVRWRTDPPPPHFFTSEEQRTAGALLDRLMGQPPGPDGRHVPLMAMVDVRLTHDQTDGWAYDTMPADRDAWRCSLAALDEDAHDRAGCSFDALDETAQCELIEAVRTWPGDRWHDLPPVQLWSLWTRYAATAFYSHPGAWAEIGFDGPAYPRGYRNLGIDRLEGIEVRDADPDAGARSAEAG